MQKSISFIIRFTLLCFWLNFILGASTVTSVAEYEFESTLEVLQGAKLCPGDTMMCGPVCLYIAAKYLNIEPYSLSDIVKITDWDYVEGTSILGLENACKRMGLHTRALKLNANQLGKLMNQNNALAVVESRNHFFLLLKSDDGAFLKITTPVKPQWVRAHEITDTWDWDGKVLLFSKQAIKTDTPLKTVLCVLGIGGCSMVVLAILVFFWNKYFQRKIKMLSTTS
jgi:hypothetical protein